MGGFKRGGTFPISQDLTGGGAGNATVAVISDAANRQLRMQSLASDGTGLGRVLVQPELCELRSIDDSGVWESRLNVSADGDPGVRAAAQILLAGSVALWLNHTGAVKQIGFYGANPVAQAAHPVTLADVITLLTNLGLCA